MVGSRPSGCTICQKVWIWYLPDLSNECPRRVSRVAFSFLSEFVPLLFISNLLLLIKAYHFFDKCTFFSAFTDIHFLAASLCQEKTERADKRDSHTTQHSAAWRPSASTGPRARGRIADTCRYAGWRTACSKRERVAARGSIERPRCIGPHLA